MAILSKLIDRAYLIKEHKHLEIWHRLVGLYVFVFMVWGLYRLLFRFPVWFEELVLKALVFGVPVFWVALKKDKLKLQDLGISGENLFPSVYMGIAVGVVLGFMGEIGNFIRHGGLQFSSYGLTKESVGGFLLLALVTAWWEELLFAGYILQRLGVVIKDEWNRVWVSAGLFVLLHVPALLFVQKVSMLQGLFYGLLLFTVGVGNAVVMLRTKNLMAPILLHALWGVTVYLFR